MGRDMQTEIPTHHDRVIHDIRSERCRQLVNEGWTKEHDDTHVGEQLAMAAACYAMPRDYRASALTCVWPWSRKWWKPGDRRRELVKAAALIVAEIERRDRNDTQPQQRTSEI